MKERLDVILVRQGFAASREKAKALLMAGNVFVDNQREDKAGTLFDESKIKIEVKGKPLPYVSRGGLKLERAVGQFPIILREKVCMDIGASTGSGIVAAAAGTVVIATYSYSAGNYIMINHGGGVYTVYMHCSQLLASEGQDVIQGQTIAKVGSTGYSTGPHLHFGIRANGQYVNPSNYVSP